jgi:hypothetical protein
MKKVFLASLIVFGSSLALNAQSGLPTSSSTVNNCSTRVIFFGLTDWTGSITTTTITYNPLDGTYTKNESSKGCGINGGSWDWPWE